MATHLQPEAIPGIHNKKEQLLRRTQRYEYNLPKAASDIFEASSNSKAPLTVNKQIPTTVLPTGTRKAPPLIVAEYGGPTKEEAEHVTVDTFSKV